MNHLIIYAHPNTNSFTKAITDSVKDFSMKQEYKTEVRDLYSMGFDPVLNFLDFSGIQSGKVPEDIKREQGYIKWADIITFVYPIWWTGMPAILKGYIDRVFSYSMVYKQGNNGSKGLLKDKKVFIFSPMGTSNENYNKNGITDAIKQVSDTGIFNFCGMKVEQHAFFGEVPTAEEEIRKQYLQAVSEIFYRSLNPSKNNKDNSQNNKNKDSQNDNESNNNSKDRQKSNQDSSSNNDNKNIQSNNKDKIIHKF